MVRGRRKNRVDARVGVIERYAANGGVSGQIIFVGVVESMPSDNVEWGMILLGREEMAVEFGQYVPCCIGIFVKGRHGCLEVACIG